MSENHALRLLLMDSDRPVKMLLERQLTAVSPVAVAFRSGEDAEDLLTQQPFDVSQLDFELPGIGRVETRKRNRGGEQASDLLLIHPHLSGEGADLPTAEHLDDDDKFLTKPLMSAEVAKYARRALSLRADRRTPEGGQEILGDSRAMIDVLDIVERVAAGSASVLINGETGTGKTMVARRIHELSPRSDQRFVAINCSAFQDQLLESELFGHERGAFTGALAVKQGLFEVADGGSLFLDEVGDMSASMQAKLLQVLDDGMLRRVGGNKMHKVDVRVIAATNKDVKQEVKAGRFREDLLFRLNVIHLTMPRLAERPEDIPLLVAHFMKRFRLPGRPTKQVSPEAIQLLMNYSWPGNVRELANAIEGLILLAPGDEIRAQDLPQSLRPKSKFQLDDFETPLPLAEIERLHIMRTIKYTEGKKAPAARLLGVDVKTLNSKLKKYEIEV